MQVSVCAKCSSNGQTTTFNEVTVQNEGTILDLKTSLQERLSVGACDMKVYYRERLTVDSQTIKSLYIREGDCFNLEYPSSCNIVELKAVLHIMKDFVERVCNVERPGMFFSEEQWATVEDCYNDVTQACDDCSTTLFMPWNNPVSVVSRHFFRQEGGLDFMSTIFKHVHKNFAQDGEDEPWKVRARSFQQESHYSCLVALWNYSEIKEDRLQVLDKIGLDMFISSLLCEDKSSGILPDICDAAVGCLVQYVEIPEMQLEFCQSHEAVTKLINLSFNGTNLYHREVASNALFCVSNHPEAALRLVKMKTHVILVNAMQSISTHNLSVAIQYFFSLFLANIRTLPEEDWLCDEEKSAIDAILEKFLVMHTPSELEVYEEEHSYVWITLKPFVQMAFSASDQPPRTSSPTDDPSDSPQCTLVPHQYCFFPAAKIGLFALCHLVKRNPSQDLFRSEKLIDSLVCISWFATGCEHTATLVPNTMDLPKVDPPRLKSIAMAYLAKCYGYKII